MPSTDTADTEAVARRHGDYARTALRFLQLREEIAIHADDVRHGRFRNMAPRPPEKPMGWDGTKNSQIVPIGR